MRIIHRYITTAFLVTFAVTLVVFTFVMCIGLIFKVNDLLVRGVPWRPILDIVLSGVPSLFALSIPISLITSSLLVFGRLSADGELTAMRACGISLEQIMAGPLVVGVVMTLICGYINAELAPEGLYKRRDIKSSLAGISPLELIEEGCFIRDFEGLTIYIGRKEGTRLTDVRISDSRERGLRREIRAKSGDVVYRAGAEGGLTLNLYDVRVDPFSRETPDALFCKTWPIDIPREQRKRVFEKRDKDMTNSELLDRIADPGRYFSELKPPDLAEQVMALRVELNGRLAMAASCFAFILLGIPLGLKAHRQESTIGIAISLMVVFNFYLFIIIADSLVRVPAARPDLICWVPVFLSIIGGTRLMKHNA